MLEHPAPTLFARKSKRPSLGLIGAGAFGQFCIPHLARFFDLRLCDASPGVVAVAAQHDIEAVDLAEIAGQNVIILAVPLKALAEVARAIAPHLKPGALVIDVCSVKMKPLALLRESLPDFVEIIGTHPLFGPQSGRDGIAGLPIAICGGGAREKLLARFLREKLKLKVIRTSAEDHDRQMAHVQGLTHVIARAIVAMDLPTLALATPTFGHLMRMVDTVRHDSEELFRTIAAENPFVDQVKREFLGAVTGTLKGLEARTPLPAGERVG